MTLQIKKKIKCSCFFFSQECALNGADNIKANMSIKIDCNIVVKLRFQDSSIPLSIRNERQFIHRLSIVRPNCMRKRTQLSIQSHRNSAHKTKQLKTISHESYTSHVLCLKIGRCVVVVVGRLLP